MIQALGKDVSLDDTLWAAIPKTGYGRELIMLDIVETHLGLPKVFTTSAKNTGLDLFGQLINNQPGQRHLQFCWATQVSRIVSTSALASGGGAGQRL